MSVESMAKALRVPDLDPTDKLLLVGIANHDGDGGAWPSLTTLATYLGKSVRSVQRHLGNLEQRGLITREIGAGGNGKTRNDRRPTLYTLHLNGVTVDVTPPSERGDTRGDTLMSPRGPNEVTDPAPRGDRAMSPEPSIEPSVEEEPSNNKDAGASASDPITFDAFWNEYPKKIGKGDSRLLWAKMSVKDRQDAVRGAQRHEWYLGNHPGVYVLPAADVWLRHRRWEDEEPRRPPVAERRPTQMDRVREARAAKGFQ